MGQSGDLDRDGVGGGHRAVIDYEHQSMKAGTGPAPAAGWVQKLSIVDGKNGAELWATVEWTEKAAQMIRAGEYKFCSPVIDWESTDRKTGKSVGAELLNLALTNNPFLDGHKPIELTRVSAMAEEPPAKMEPPHDVKADDLDVSDEAKAWIKEAGTAEEVEGNPPAWVGDEATWERAKEAVRPKWGDYAEPWAVVAHVYRQMGGTVASRTTEASRVTTMAEEPPPPPAEKPAEEKPAEEKKDEMPAEMALAPDFNSWGEGIAKAAGVDTAAALACLEQLQDDIAKAVAEKIERQGIPAAMQKPMGDAAALSILVAKVTALESELTAMKAGDAARRTAEIAAEADRLIREGHATADQRDNVVHLLTNDPERARALFKSRVVPIGEMQAGNEPVKPKPSVTKLSDLPAQKQMLARSLMAAGFGSEKACIERAITAEN